MRTEPPLPPGNRRQHGVALIIVLAFIVLLTGLIIAYFSRAVLDRQISNSSSSRARVAVFANGAVDSIVGDLKQEILAGSIITGTAISGTTYYTYAPSQAWAAVPCQSGTTGGALWLPPNVVKRSAGGQPFYNSSLSISGSSVYPNAGAYPPSTRAIALSSTSVSLNGRYISLDRWNAPLLMPTVTGSTPTPLTSGTFANGATWNYAPPDWILVSRSGTNPQISGAVPAVNLTTGTDPVLGRYAYTIYDEGGLLDMNAAGYPSALSVSQAAYKAALPFADLTQIGLTQSQVDQIVGWRNYATSSASGAFPGYTYSSGSNYYNFALSATTGFLTVGNATLNNGQSDRMFSSREELIKLITQGIGAPQSVLQYLGTFSRGLQQPSYVPNPSRPTIVGTSLPPGTASVNSYQGNNTYYGGDGAINLTGSGGFLGVRALSAFTRSDGSAAVVGEPLVKRKFALSRLQQITTTATATASTSNPIYAEFGLSRSSATAAPWVYNHGGGGIIMTLQKVASAGREADFAELLKAAIAAGSVGKGGPSGQGNNGQYLTDVSGDLQILQIMADLIDQQKADNYPTWIQFVDSSSVTHNIYGVQNVPYFYRWHYFGVTTKVPSPLLASTDTVVAVSGTGTGTINHARLQGATVLQSGSAAYMIIPEVWNPHDANTLPASAGGPTTFRVVAVTNDPTQTLGAWGIYAVPGNGSYPPQFDGAPGSIGGSGYTAANPPSSAWSTPIVLGSNNAFVQFTDNSGGRAFREPTLLWRNTISGVTLSGTSVTEDPSLTGNTYFGILVGVTPVSWVNQIVTTTGTANCIFQTSSMQKGASTSAVPNSTGPPGALTDNITFLTQYQDASGNWITYQVAFFQATQPDYPDFTLFVNAAEYTGGNAYKYKNPLMVGVNGSGSALAPPQGDVYDPRSERWTSPITGHFTDDDPTLNGNPSLDAVTLVANNNPSSSQNQTVGTSNFVLMKTQRPATSIGQMYEYTTPNRGYNWTMHWYSSQSWTWYGNGFSNSVDSNWYEGLLSQNNPAVQLLNANGSGVEEEYYEDPDGVTRPAMGAYVPVTGSAPTGRLTNVASTSTIGLPMVTSGTSISAGIVTPTTQSQSRPIILHRPFRSVAEMGYAFRGTPWKNIDFFTAASGDSALLDVFCVNEPPSNAMVAGKVDLNTRQAPVLQALLSGAYRDELTTDNVPPLSATEAGNIGNTLVGITTSTQAWRGPLTNVGDLVGHFVPNAPSTLSGADYYQCPIHNASGLVTGTNTYAGFSAALSGTSGNGSDIWATTPANNNISSPSIQRFRESAIRPLADCGQTRVWNLLIDVIAQVGRYSPGAGSTANFSVEGEKRYWVHIAIDRLTAQVIDCQFEAVAQ